LQLKDIPLPEGVELLGDLDSNIVTCVGSASGRAGAGDSEEEKATDETAAAEESSDTTENSGASE